MARDKNEKIWIAGGVASSLLLGGAVWTFVVSPQLDEVDSLHSQTADARTQNVALQSRVSKLQNEYAHLGDTKRQLADAQAQLPADSALSALTTQLSTQARATHVSITQLTAVAPAPFVASSSAGAAAPAPASSAAPAAGKTPATGLYSIQVSVAVSGTQAAELAFARAVQNTGPRSALVSSVQLQNSSGATGRGATSAGGAGKGSSMTIQMNVFVAPPAARAPTATPTTGA